MDEARPDPQRPPDQPQPRPPAAPRPQPPARPHPARDGYKETIESVLIAFILAFVFRAFVVEAFVIPSGSMAPTLLGAHMRFDCEQCGWQFDVNYPGASQTDTVDIPPVYSGNLSAHCANCGFKIRRLDLDAGLRGVPPPPQPATNPTVRYGDRILVLKYLSLFRQPARWDVVVFKSPSAGAQDYAVNFIKRLVGGPGETIMLLDGDIYACPNDQAEQARRRHGDDWVAHAPWKVQTKHQTAQEALWRIIYDNDFFPRQLPGLSQAWVMPWKQEAGSGWTTGSPQEPSRIVRFDNPAGSGTLQFDRTANRGTYPFTDWLPYNESRPGTPFYGWDTYGDEAVPRWNVSDLRLKFAYQRLAGEGPLRASMTKYGHRFTAELTPSAARLIHQKPDGTSTQIGPDVRLDPARGWVMVDLQNVDYRASLRLDGREVLATTAADYAPDLPGHLLPLHREHLQRAGRGDNRQRTRDVFPPPAVELQAADQSCELAHLSLWRDIYYTPLGAYMEANRHGSPENPARLGRAGDGLTAQGTPQENEYFVLGDNSILSLDARAWRDPVDLAREADLFVEPGRVPERFMLGKAFFVYWPAGYRPVRTSPGIIPNFGEMRFIH
jgi:signal peptidase I